MSVYDDGSTDNTADIVEEYREKFGSVGINYIIGCSISSGG